MICPDGCMCDKLVFVQCNHKSKFISKIEFNFPVKKLSIQYNQNLSSLLPHHKNHVVVLSITNSPMKTLINLNLKNLFILVLRYNNIKVLSSSTLNHLKNLQYLDLTGNEISIIPDRFFYQTKNLLFLDLSGNLIKTINNFVLSHLFKLKTLVVTYSQIENLDEKSLKNLVSLENLYLNHTQLPRYLSLRLLSNLKNLKRLYSESYYLCCMTEKYNFTMEECKPDSSLIKVCMDLIGNRYLRIAIWILVVIGLIGNSIALFIQQQNFKSNSIFFMGLHISDIFLVMYLGIIGVADIHYKGNYMENDAKWRFSSMCSFAGVLANTSLMNSNFCLLLITIERYLAICHTLIHKKYFYSIQQLVAAFSGFLLISCMIGIMPIAVFEVNICVLLEQITVGESFS